jgi:non-homologous end joining protein Ku
LIRSKQAGLPTTTQKAPSRPANVVSLMDALKRSIDGTSKGKPAKTKKTEEPAAKPKRRAKG